MKAHRYHAPSPLILVLLFLTTTALAAPAPPSPGCTTTVYIYIDVSASLSSRQQEELAANLERILTSDQGGPISIKNNAVLIPFADRVGRADPVAEATKAGAAIRALLSGKPEDDAGNRLSKKTTDVIAVLRSIQKRLRDPAVARTHTVFIVASDFEHDTSPRDTHDDYLTDWSNWDEQSKTVLNQLEKGFASPSGPILLLLRINHDPAESLSIGETVVRELRRLILAESQLHLAGDGDFNLTGFLPYFLPFSITPRMAPEGLKFEIEDRACFNLPVVTLFALKPGTSGDKFALSTDTCSGTALRNHHCSTTISRDQLPPPAASGRSAADEVIFHLVIPRVAGRPEPKPVDLSVNVDQYLFLLGLTGSYDPGLNTLEGEALVQSALWETGSTGKINLELLEDGRSIGEGSLDTAVDPEPGGGMIARVVRDKFTIKMSDGDLASLCYEEEEPDLILRAKATPTLPGLEQDSLPVRIRRNQKNLLQDIINHGSLPAVATLFTIILMTLRHREASLAHVHEVLGVAGGFWLILFFLLHRIPMVAAYLNKFFVGRYALFVACAICFVLAVLGVILSWKGVIAPARRAEEIALRILREKEPADQSKTRKKRWLRWRRIGSWARAIMLPLVPFALMIFMLYNWRSIVPACTFQVTEELPVESEGGQNP